MLTALFIFCALNTDFDAAILVFSLGTFAELTWFQRVLEQSIPR